MTLHPARTIPFTDLLSGLRERQQHKLVHRQEGPDGLSLWTYSRECQYTRAWDAITVLARGLILHEASSTVVATPFPKFFNLGEATIQSAHDGTASSVPDLPFEVFTKLDGSLIILYWWQGSWRTATKGSFTSAQAHWAQKKLLSYSLASLNPTNTYLCEAIYPENRIVVPYKEEHLYLLAAYDPTGKELPYDSLQVTSWATTIPHVIRHEINSVSFLVERAATLPLTEEGWVLRFSTGLRLKIKGEEYKRLHRCIAGVTPLNLWEAMRDSADLSAMRRDVPEEFWTDFDTIQSILEGLLRYWCERVEAETLLTADWTDRELASRLPTLAPTISKWIFTCRRQGTKGILDHPTKRSLFFRLFRPTHNHLSGYRPTSAMQRVQDDALTMCRT